MQELAREYQVSLKMLSKGINKLKHELYIASNDPFTEVGINELRRQINLLISMQRDTREIATVVEHYHERSYWRDERYTLNSRKSRKFIYVGPSRH